MLFRSGPVDCSVVQNSSSRLVHWGVGCEGFHRRRIGVEVNDDVCQVAWRSILGSEELVELRHKHWRFVDYVQQGNQVVPDLGRWPQEFKPKLFIENDEVCCGDESCPGWVVWNYCSGVTDSWIRIAGKRWRKNAPIAVNTGDVGCVWAARRSDRCEG